MIRFYQGKLLTSIGDKFHIVPSDSIYNSQKIQTMLWKIKNFVMCSEIVIAGIKPEV